MKHDQELAIPLSVFSEEINRRVTSLSVNSDLQPIISSMMYSMELVEEEQTIECEILTDSQLSLSDSTDSVSDSEDEEPRNMSLIRLNLGSPSSKSLNSS